MFLISSASKGEANVQTILKILYQYFVSRDFSVNPTMKHLINGVRIMFKVYEQGLFTREDEDNGDISLLPTILFENDAIKNQFLDDSNTSDLHFVPKYKIEIADPNNSAVISAIRMGEDPNPVLYVDARGKGVYEWILSVK